MVEIFTLNGVVLSRSVVVGSVAALFCAWWIWYYSVSHQIKIGVDNLAKSTVPPLEDPEKKGKKVETGGWSTWEMGNRLQSYLYFGYKKLMSRFVFFLQ